MINDGLMAESEFMQFFHLSAIPALEKITGKSFGSCSNARVISSMRKAKKVSDENERIRKAWLTWWEKEGKKKYQ